MKYIKHVTMIGLLVMISGPLFAQSEAVLNAFSERYSFAKNAQWEQEDSNWKVEFTVRDRSGEAIFTSSGEWIQTEMQLERGELPKEVKASLKTDYPEFEIKEAEAVTAPGSYWYEVELTMDDKELEVAYSAEGEQMNKVSEDQDDEMEDADEQDDD